MTTFCSLHAFVIDRVLTPFAMEAKSRLLKHGAHLTRVFIVLHSLLRAATGSLSHMDCTEVFSHDASHDRVAFGTQGKCVDVLPWADIISKQHLSYQIDFFFLVFDVDPQECLPGYDVLRSQHSLIYSPGSTWNAGRNSIAKNMHMQELTSGTQYKYWVFADQDARYLDCEYCKHMPLNDRVSCCYDHFLHFLLGPQQFAVVALNANQQDANAYADFSRHECVDAQLNAFHRAAVPLLLPYTTELDNTSWWYSQYILYHVSYGCLRGGIVTLGGFVWTESEHSSYPKGVDQSVGLVSLKKIYSALIPWPIATSDKPMMQLGCLSMEMYHPWERRFTSACKSSAWHAAHEYKACVAALKPQYESFLHSITSSTS